MCPKKVLPTLVTAYLFLDRIIILIFSKFERRMGKPGIKFFSYYYYKVGSLMKKLLKRILQVLWLVCVHVYFRSRAKLQYGTILERRNFFKIMYFDKIDLIRWKCILFLKSNSCVKNFWIMIMGLIMEAERFVKMYSKKENKYNWFKVTVFLVGFRLFWRLSCNWKKERTYALRDDY